MLGYKNTTQQRRKTISEEKNATGILGLQAMDLVVFAVRKELGVQTARRWVLALQQLLPPREQESIHYELEPWRECFRFELVHETL